MKKILTLLSGLSLVSISSMSVVSCTTKTVTSLNDPNYSLAKDDDSGFRFDIMQWSSDVLANSKYKEHFLSLFETNYLLSEGKDAWSMTDLIKGQKDNDGEIANQEPITPTTIATVMSEYQASSNTGENIGSWTAEALDKEFIYKIYDGNQPDQNGNPTLITAFNEHKSGHWVDSGEVVVKKNEDSGAFVFSFLVAIDASESEYFTGARINVPQEMTDAELANYYKGIKKDQIPTTSEHDYRYKIEFNFQLS